MKAINIENIRTIRGISIYEILKSISNEYNFSDEDWEYELPKKTRYNFRYYNKDKNK